MKKKEISIFATTLLLALFLWVCMTIYRQSQDYGSIRITVDGVEFGTYSLKEDQVIHIGTGNTCEIVGGVVKMISADCPDKLCMQQPAVNENGGSIICLPNQVVIEGIASASSDQPQVDAIG